jgi:NADPH-dependent 2,4-dienoyl-CoA reductase/sulfur reductase-like enzyme
VTFRAVIIGGDAAGMSAATRIKGARPDGEVVVLERTRFTSYSACGIPFVVGGLVAGGVEALVARSPEEHRRRGIDVRIHHDATGIDLDAGEVEFLDQHAGTIGRVGFDELLIATGGAAVRPDLPGIDLPIVRGVQSLADAQTLLALADDGCRRIVIVGGGYIGLEMAEAYVERGCTATVVEKAEQPLAVVDPDFGARVSEALRHHGVDVRCGTTVEGFEPKAVVTGDGPIDADLVILGIGVRPRSELAADAGIELGVKDAIRVDARQATSAAHVWSAGDCAETTNLVSGQPGHIALGTYANRHGRVAGLNMAGGDARSPGVLGTAITKLCALEVGLTGLRLEPARDAGIDAFATTIDTTTAAGYLPTAAAMTVRLVAEHGTGRVLGAQIIGGPGSAKRIDTVATAITAGMSVADVMDLDLAYAPPFSSVWDPVAVAAREAVKDV